MADANGILNVIKPLEWTSMEVVRRVRRLTGQKKVGHAGTLDPQATGVLPICIGQATRVMEYLVDSPKTYSALVHLGVLHRQLRRPGADRRRAGTRRTSRSRRGIGSGQVPRDIQPGPSHVQRPEEGRRAALQPGKGGHCGGQATQRGGDIRPGGSHSGRLRR